MDELGNLLLEVCYKVEFENGSWLGKVDSLTSSFFFSCECELAKTSPLIPI